MYRIPFFLLRVFSALLLFWCLPASSALATMEVQFTGIVTDSFVEGPPLGDPFGLGNGSGVLNGLEVTGSLTYEPGSAPPDSNELPEGVLHLTNGQMGAASDAWFSMPEVFIDDQLVPLPSFIYVPTLPGENVAWVALADELFGEDGVEYFRTKFETQGPADAREYTVRITVSGADIIDSLLLTNAYEVIDFTNLTSFGQVVVRQTNPASATYDFFAEFELTSLTVPEPAVSMGLAAGLMAILALVPRRRRSCRP